MQLFFSLWIEEAALERFSASNTAVVSLWIEEVAFRAIFQPGSKRLLWSEIVRFGRIFDLFCFLLHNPFLPCVGEYFIAKCRTKFFNTNTIKNSSRNTN